MPPLLLHVFPSFETGGAQMRTVTLMNALEDRFRHSVIALNGDLSCAERIHSGVAWTSRPAPASRHPAAAAWRFRAVLREVRPSLLLTYNWGAIDALLALLPGRLCPAVHVEDGFGPDEAAGLKARRVWTRRLVLPRVTRWLVAPSRTLCRIAVERYRLPEGHIRHIPNGVDVARFRPHRRPDLRRVLGIPEQAVVFGAVARLRPEKDLAYLVARFAEARLPEACLLIAGGGPGERELREAVRARGLADQVVFAGDVRDAAPYYGVMDVFAMSSITEQMPIGLLEAMSSGLPALCTDVGDTRHLLPTAHRQLAVPREQPELYTAALRRLAGDPAWRAALGAENRARACAEFSMERMVERWERLYREAAGISLLPEQQHEHIP
mgnify:CR=1 FL=1